MNVRVLMRVVGVVVWCSFLGCSPWMMQLPAELETSHLVVPVEVNRYAIIGSSSAGDLDPGMAITFGDTEARIVESGSETLVRAASTQAWYSSIETDELQRRYLFVFSLEGGRVSTGERVECLIVKDQTANTHRDFAVTSYDTARSDMECRIWSDETMVGTLTSRMTTEHGDYAGSLNVMEKNYTFHSIHHVTNFSMRRANPVGYALQGGQQTLAAVQLLHPERLLIQGELPRADLHAAILLGTIQFYRQALTEGIAGL